MNHKRTALFYTTLTDYISKQKTYLQKPKSPLLCSYFCVQQKKKGKRKNHSPMKLCSMVASCSKVSDQTRTALHFILTFEMYHHLGSTVYYVLHNNKNQKYK